MWESVLLAALSVLSLLNGREYVKGAFHKITRTGWRLLSRGNGYGRVEAHDTEATLGNLNKFEFEGEGFAG